MSPFSGGTPGSTTGGPLGGGSTPGINLNLPNISIGGGGSPGSSNQPTSGSPANNLAWLLPLLPLLGLAGYFPTNYDETGTSDTTTDTSGKTTLDTVMNFLTNYSQQQTGVTGVQPTLSPATQEFMDKLIGRYSGLSAPSLTGYGAQQTANINAASNVQQQAIQNILAARGLSTSPVAATAQAGAEQNRLNQITSMQQGLPILKNQMDLQNLAGASAFFGAIPKGSLTTSATQTSGETTGSQTGSQTGTSQSTSTAKGTTTKKGTQGGGPAGLLGGLGAAYAYLLPYLLGLGGAKTPPITGLPKQPGQPGAEGGSFTNPGSIPYGTGEQGTGGTNLSPTTGTSRTL